MDLKKLAKVADANHIVDTIDLKKPLGVDLISQLADLSEMSFEEFVHKWGPFDEYELQDRYESETEFDEEFDDWYDNNVTEQPGSDDSDSWIAIYQLDKVPESLEGVQILHLTEEQAAYAENKLSEVTDSKHISDVSDQGKALRRSNFLRALPDKEKALKIAEGSDSYTDGMELHGNVVQIWYEMSPQVRNAIERAKDKGIKAESAGDMSVKFYL